MYTDYEGAQAPPIKKLGQIEDSLQLLSKRATNLVELLAKLAQELNPILRQVPNPSVGGDAKADGANAPMANRLEAISADLMTCLLFIEDIENRLEL